jgi:preprotein translocase subunit SecA
MDDIRALRRYTRDELLRAVQTTNAAGEMFPPPDEVWPPKVGRNDPCPCESGAKYKHCGA